MADSLVLKGVKDVRRHTGTEMQLVIPKRGGNVHQIKRWWQKGVSTVYAGCTVFDVITTGGLIKLVVATGKSESPTVRIDHDGDGKFTFSQINELERAALFTANFELIEHYIFPSIAGGSIVTVKPADSADRPSAGPPAPTIGTVTLTGEQAPTNGDTESYTVSISGDASPTYVLTSSDGADTVSGLDVTFGSDGPRTLTVTATDAAASDNPATGTLSITASVLFSAAVAAADLSVAVTVADTGNGNKYQIDGVEQDGIVATAGATIHFDLSDASLSGHPFKIYTDSSKTTEVTVGIEQEGTDLLFTPPIAGSFSYQCENHANMGGDITVNAA